MRRKNIALVILGSTIAVLSSFVVYATRAHAGDAPVWLSAWMLKERAWLGIVLVLLSVVNAVVEVVRASMSERQEHRQLLQKLMDEFAKKEFKSRSRQNRLTLFRAEKGWKCFLKGALRLLRFDRPYRWRALARIRWRATYLCVYVRAAESRNVRSSTVLQVSDDATECEGMAGTAWEEGYVIVPNMPKLEAAAVRAVPNLAQLPNSDPIRRYAKATNMQDLRLLKSMDHFARHFMGYVVKRADATRWGVILLDSEEERCPFSPASGGGPLGERLSDTARLFSKIIS